MNIDPAVARGIAFIKRNPKVLLPQLVFFALIALLFSAAPLLSYYLVLLPNSAAHMPLTLDIVQRMQVIFRSLLVLQIGAVVLAAPLFASMVIFLADASDGGRPSLRTAFGNSREIYGELVLTNLVAVGMGLIALAGVLFALGNLPRLGAILSGLSTTGFLIAIFAFLILFCLAYYNTFFQALTITCFTDYFGPEAISMSISASKLNAGRILSMQLPIAVPFLAAYAVIELISVIFTAQPAIGFSMAIDPSRPFLSTISQLAINGLQVLVLATAETLLLASSGIFYQSARK